MVTRLVEILTITVIFTALLAAIFIPPSLPFISVEAAEIATLSLIASGSVFISLGISLDYCKFIDVRRLSFRLVLAGVILFTYGVYNLWIVSLYYPEHG